MNGGRRIVMAQVRGAHGVRGAVKLAVFTEDPLSLRRYNPFEDAAGRRYKLAAVRAAGKHIVAEIEGLTDRTAAEALRGTELLVPRSRLPRPDEEEFYHVDLIGLNAQLADGAPLGKVAAVVDYGAGDILEIVGARTVLVPFTREVVPCVDIGKGTLTVDPPPGLLDEDEDEPPPDAPAHDGTNDRETGDGRGGGAQGGSS